MREENYFEKKLEVSKDTLRYTESELESVDIQIKKLQREFDYNLDIYNKRATRLQEIKTNMETKIESLQKKLEQGYICIDMRTGKAYKSFADRHKADLEQKAKDAEERYKEQKKAYDLKKKRKEIPKPIVKAPTGEVIPSQLERELELLKEKAERLEAQRKELELKAKEPEIEPKDPKPIIEDAKEPEIAENGKIICDICGQEFSKAGFPNHRIACEKKKFERELQEARDKLALLEAGKELEKEDDAEVIREGE